MSLPSQEKVLTLSSLKVSISGAIKFVNSIPYKVNMKFNFMLNTAMIAQVYMCWELFKANTYTLQL